MTKELVESHFIDCLQREISIYNKEDRLLKTGKLVLFNIREYTIQLVMSKKGTTYTYEIPYPFNIVHIIDQTNKIKLDYTVENLCKNDVVLKAKLNLCAPVKKNKFYNTVITIKYT